MSSTYKEIERKITESKKSKKIILDKLSLTTLPGSTTLNKLSTKHIESIEELIFTNNLVQTIDDKSILTNLTKLERLDLSHNNLTTINDLAFGNTPPSTLTEINLSHNKLSEFPQFVCSVGVSLTSLILTHNNIVTLPPGIFDRLSTLTSLDLSFNSLCSLPSGITSLSETLRTLSLRGNRIARAAEGTLGALRELTSLDLSDNRLTRLPSDLLSLGSLDTLALAGNPWESPRAAVCEAGKDAVFAELERLSSAKGCAATSRVVDLCCAHVNSDANDCVKFAVVVCDPQGVPRITGGDEVASTLEGPEKIAGNVADNNSGVYVVGFDVKTPGTYKLSVSVNDSPLPSTPFTIHVWPTLDNTLQKDSDDDDNLSNENDRDIFEAISKAKEESKEDNDDGDSEEEEEDSNGKLFAGAIATCREYNIPINVPEILICGAAGYEEVVEAVAGVFPLKIPRGCLRRPLILNFIYSDKVSSASKPEITLMKDPLLGSSVPMGLRDAPIDDPSTLPTHIQRRNSAASSTPVTIQFAGRYSLPHRIVVAPALPSAADAATAAAAAAANADGSGDADMQQAAASAFLDGKLRTCAAAVCVLPAMEWRLVQTSSWLPRLRAADPTLSHTHFMFTGLAPFLATFHSAVALADFLKGRPGYLSCCFATLPSDKIAAKCVTHAEYSAALAALATRDINALERLWGDRDLRASIGVIGLRRTLASALRTHYRDVLPRLQQHIADTRAAKQTSAASAAAARAALDSPELPAMLRAAATERAIAFSQAVASTLRGSAAAASVAAPLAAEAGTTLAEEVDAVLDTGFPLRGLVLADASNATIVPRANARIYGGAQIDRLIAYFRACARQAAEAPPAFPDAMAHCSACGNKAAAAVAPACQAARAEARAALVPLINFLADAAVLAVKRCADVADQVLDRSVLAKKSGYATTTEIPSLVDFSYLSTNVSGIFVELASAAIENLRDSCVEQIACSSGSGSSSGSSSGNRSGSNKGQGQIPQNDFGIPDLVLIGLGKEEAEEAVREGRAEWLAEKIFTAVVNAEAQTVAGRFYEALLDELTVRVPAETHATIMGFEEERIMGMFKIQGLRDVLDDQKVELEEEIEMCAQKQKEISEIAIN